MIFMLGFLTTLLTIAGLTGVYRAYRGPQHLDRVLALDYISIVGIGIVILLVAKTGEPMVLDLGICLALVGFITAYIFSKFAIKEKESCKI